MNKLIKDTYKITSIVISILFLFSKSISAIINNLKDVIPDGFIIVNCFSENIKDDAKVLICYLLIYVILFLCILILYTVYLIFKYRQTIKYGKFQIIIEYGDI